MAEFSFTAQSLEDTLEFAQKCADNTSSQSIFTLQGPMGAGKSEFARSFIRYLMKDENLEVPSPTFTLVQSYETSHFPIWHFDLYRLTNPDEIYEIGWEEALSSGVLLVEWPERLGSLLPEDRTEIIIEPIGSELRKISICDYQRK